MTGIDAFNEYRQEIELAKRAFNNMFAFKSISCEIKHNRKLVLTMCGRPDQIRDFNNYQLKMNTINLKAIANWLTIRNMTGRCELSKRCFSPKLHILARNFNQDMAKNELLLNLDYLFLCGFLNNTENMIKKNGLSYEEVKQSLEAVQILLTS